MAMLENKEKAFKLVFNINTNKVKEDYPKKNDRDVEATTTTTTNTAGKKKESEDKPLTNFEFNKPRCINSNLGQNKLNENYIYFLNQINNINQRVADCSRKLNEFETFRQLGLAFMSNTQNINHYLLGMNSNYLNSNFNLNNINPFSPFNNNINFSFNYFGNQNPLLTNYIQNQNFLNDMRVFNNLNNISNSKSIKPKKYTITLKTKTNVPNIEKVSKIEVYTSYHNKKDNSKINTQNINNNNNAPVKNEKLIKNKINIEDIMSGKEKRTVVRLNPIPPSYSSFDISKLLNKYLKIENGKNQRIYKAIYTPLCKIIGKNLGYCFIMLAQPKYVIDFHNVFSGRILGKKKCNKPCNVIWAEIQGEEFLKLNENDPIRKPLIFKDIVKD